MFNWLREKVKAAILQGVNDAVAELQQPITVEPVAIEYEREPVEVNGRRKAVRQ
jgi:hypothetical protein